eukprot:COSAG06_NODE_27831_length_585_cov_1.567901_1_plen_46_part_01
MHETRRSFTKTGSGQQPRDEEANIGKAEKRQGMCFVFTQEAIECLP